MVNYFELYQLPVTFHPDMGVVRSKYYELSRRFHPDRFAQATEHERAEALKIAALNNDAYKTLSNPDKTMAYVLKLNELVEDEEKYSLPPDFLMEMMDLNELISEYEMEHGNEEMKQRITNIIAEQFKNWENEVEPLLKRFDEGEQNKELLLQIKDYYFRRKYLLRIQQRIDTFATH